VAKLKSNRSFSFTEILITVSILSVLIIFIFRALNTCLAAAQFSQNISTACLLAEYKLWEAELKARGTPDELTQSGIENINGREFAWSCAVRKFEDSKLLRLDLKTSWNEKARNEEYSLDLFTYFFKESAAP
jgi:type II secretion system protein I